MKNCIVPSLEREDSLVRAADGKDIPFARAVLKINNVCATDVVEIAPHVSFGQEGGTVQDVSQAVVGQGALSIPPGGNIRRDVFDVLLPAHPGSASKVHMFGYRAVLNWRFELTAYAEYRLSGSSERERTPVKTWTFWWSVPDAASRAVELTIEEGKDNT